MSSNEEQHERLVMILSSLVPVLDCDDLSLLAHSCGIPVSEFYDQPNNELWRNENEHRGNDIGRVWNREINQPSQSRPF